MADGDLKVQFQGKHPYSIAAPTSGRHYEFRMPGLYEVDPRDWYMIQGIMVRRCCGKGQHNAFVIVG